MLAAVIISTPKPWSAMALGVAAVLFAVFFLTTLRPLRSLAQVSCECHGGPARQITARTVSLNALLALLAAICSLAAVTVRSSTTDSVLMQAARSPETVGYPLVFLICAVLVNRWVKGPSRAPRAADVIHDLVAPGSLAISPQALRLSTSDQGWVRPARIARAKQRAMLLLFVKEGCGACHELLEVLPALQGSASRLDVRTVGQGAQYDWDDPSGMVRAAGGIRTYPAAILFDRNGELVGSPAAGIADITALIGKA
ncbi:hypothetical protein C6401_13900 [Arthrobacter woluwensis]|nr:hypothetical protein [Arthrobacter woluwensis]PSS43134.1 hypothetical protein C6401_13900 [Arthrobacter woluwensis]